MTIALGILVGTWAFACIVLMDSCYSVSRDSTISSILTVLYSLPGVALAWRAAFVLHIMFIKRKFVSFLLNDIVALAYFSPKLVLHVFPNIRKLSVFLLVASFILQMSWPVTRLLWDINTSDFNTTTEFMWATKNQSFFFGTTNWQNLCMNMIFRHLPFVLSQQIIIMGFYVMHNSSRTFEASRPRSYGGWLGPANRGHCSSKEAHCVERYL